MSDFSEEEKPNSIDDVVNDEFENSPEETSNKLYKRGALAPDSLAYTALNVLGAIPGVIPDYFAGLNVSGIIISRGIALSLILPPMGKFYGLFREKAFNWMNTSRNSTVLRKYLTEVASFSSQILVYGAGVALASWATDVGDIKEGIGTFCLGLPFAAPIVGYVMDRFSDHPVAWKGYEKDKSP